MPKNSRLTQALSEAEGSGGLDLGDLLPELYDELRGLAGVYLRQQRANHTLQPTALVHEVYVRLVDQTKIPWSSAGHFRAIAARVMRQVLVDHARRSGAQKRGGDRLRVTLDSAHAISEDKVIDLIALDDAMNELAELHERKAKVVEFLFFGGMTHAEAAAAVGVSQKTIEADWYMARAWLGARLSSGGA